MKKVIILGASSGIGRQVAIEFLKKNYKVALTGRRKSLLHEVKSQYPNAIVSCFDVNSPQNIESIQSLINQLQGLDIFIYSAGVGDINKNLDASIIQRTIQTNVVSYADIMSWVYTFFDKQGAGHLIGISSIAGIRGGKFDPSYNASKAFQISFLEGLRQKSVTLKNKIMITDVRPGFIDTSMAKGKGIFWLVPLQTAANRIIRAIEKNKSVDFITPRWRLLAGILKVIPRSMYAKM